MINYINIGIGDFHSQYIDYLNIGLFAYQYTSNILLVYYSTYITKGVYYSILLVY